MAGGVRGVVTYHVMDEHGLHEEQGMFDTLEELFNLLMDTSEAPVRRVHDVRLSGPLPGRGRRAVTLHYHLVAIDEPAG